MQDNATFYEIPAPARPLDSPFPEQAELAPFNCPDEAARSCLDESEISAHLKTL